MKKDLLEEDNSTDTTSATFSERCPLFACLLVVVAVFVVFVVPIGINFMASFLLIPVFFLFDYLPWHAIIGIIFVLLIVGDLLCSTDKEAKEGKEIYIDGVFIGYEKCGDSDGCGGDGGD